MTSLTRLAVAACGRVYVIAVAHVMWIAGTLAGGVVLGLGPATVAVRGAVRAGMAEVSARDTAREFMRRYRDTFWRTASCWLVLQLGGCAIVVATLIGAVPPGIVGIVVRAALLSGAIVVMLCVTMWSSAAELLDLPAAPLRSIRTVTLYSIARFPLTLVMVGAHVVALLAVVQLPALLVIVGPAMMVCAVDPLERRSAKWNDVSAPLTRSAHREEGVA